MLWSLESISYPVKGITGPNHRQQDTRGQGPLDPEAARWARDDEMKAGDVVSFMLQHLVAAVVSFGIFVGGSILLVILGMFIGNDPGGPMFFPIFVLFALFGAACACLALFAVAALIQGIRRWLRFSWWVPVVLVFPLTFAVLALLGTAGSSRPDRWLPAASGIVSIAFWIYWVTLCAASGILNLIRRKRNGAQHAVPGYASQARQP